MRFLDYHPVRAVVDHVIEFCNGDDWVVAIAPGTVGAIDVVNANSICPVAVVCTANVAGGTRRSVRETSVQIKSDEFLDPLTLITR